MSKKKRVKIKASSSLHDSETAFKLYHACMRRDELLARSCELQQQGRMAAANLAFMFARRCDLEFDELDRELREAR